MKQTTYALIASLTIVSFISGLTAGYFFSPAYQMTMYTKKTMGLGPADAFVDLRYINVMAQHHTAAIILAQQIEEKTKRPEIKQLAIEIQKNEPALIDELYTWKKQWYKDPRVAPNPNVAQFGQIDETLDLRFLNALIAHHEEGIQMTQEIRTKSTRSEILNNADAVEQFLNTSLTRLRQWRQEWYNVT